MKGGWRRWEGGLMLMMIDVDEVGGGGVEREGGRGMVGYGC